MKTKLIISVLIAVCAVFVPIMAARQQSTAMAAEKEAKRISAEETESGEGAQPQPENTPDYDIKTPVESTKVNVLMGDGQAREMELEEYLVGVVAGEMPASFNTEALKAQAVAARTYTLYKILVSPSANHKEDVCTDPACCKAYSDEETLRAKWKDSYNANMEKITGAVWSTRGEYMVYDGQPVLAVFHSSSAGATESSGRVWNSDLPYLVSVQSPETAADVKNYVSELVVSQSDFRDTVLAKHPEAELSGECADWIRGIEYTESGRIQTIDIGGAVIKGTELRSMFGLRSTAAQIEVKGGDIVFTVTGYGHGVGMSQYGADVMAGEGKTYREILQWYYTGVAFGIISEPF